MGVAAGPDGAGAGAAGSTGTRDYAGWGREARGFPTGVGAARKLFPGARVAAEKEKAGEGGS